MPRSNKKGTRANLVTITLDIRVMPDKHATIKNLEDAIDSALAATEEEIAQHLGAYGFKWQSVRDFHNMKGAHA